MLIDKGIYISSELGRRNEHLWRALLSPFSPGKRVIFPLPISCRRSLAFIKGLMEKGEFKPLIDRSYALDEIEAAYTYVASGQKVGNVILKMEME